VPTAPAAPAAPTADPSTQTVPPSGLVEQSAPGFAGAGSPTNADFTRIEGIGPKLSQRLHAANIHTFADLASLPPETLAGILGWTSERLLRTRILEQAAALAQ
jgi:predicted flap endonuclease-1-like 5' DNA nuclease